MAVRDSRPAPEKGRKVISNFHLTRSWLENRGYLDRTNQVSDLWKPRNSTAFAFLSPISFLLLHPSTIIIVEKSISTFLSTNHRVTKISTHSQVKERNLFPGCISQNYLREKEERSVENRRGKPWLKHCDEYKNSWSILLSATRSVAVKKLTCISLYHLWSSLLPFQAPINHRTHPRPNPLDLAITRYRDPRASRPSNAPTSYKYNVDSIAEVHLPRSIDLSVPGTRYPSSPL